tara:strand:+ start:13224 stop:13898 length:675 start_codon:yes stop_codon:yes gene_type:complete
VNTKYLISPNFSNFYKFSPKLKVAVLASGKGSNFLNLLNLSFNNELDIDIKILISNKKDAGCIKKAIDFNIPYLTLIEENFNNKDLFEKEIINILKANEIELIVLAGWMKIISKKFVCEFKNKIINIHPSLLPAFKGRKSIQDAIDMEVHFTGCSVHYVEEEVDSGKLIIQGVLPIKKNDNKDTLTKKIHFLEHKILPYAISEAGYQIRNSFKDMKKKDSSLHS